MNTPTRAVIIGGGIGGLLAARVLSERFDEVVLVERDKLGDDAEPRKSVPQGPHLHGLLKRGELILEELFPGIVETLCANGAERLTLGRDMHWYHHDRWKTECKNGIIATFLTRPFLEAEVRRRVRSIANVRWLDEHVATEFVANSDRTRIIGIKYRGTQGDAEETLSADLVVDSSGRGTHAPAWLEALGYPRPTETELKVNVGYSTGLFRRTPTSQVPWKALVVVPAGSTRFAAVMPVEGNRWVATAAGILRDYPPGDRQGYMEFLRGLRFDGVYRTIRDAEPLSDIRTTRFPSTRWIRYDGMKRFPDGLVIIGDAVGCYNPVYGQGMSVVSVHVEILRKRLTQRGSVRDLAGFSRPFQKQVAAAVNEAWQVSAGEDFRFPEIEGKRPPGYAAMKWYMDHLHAATSVDPVVYERFLQVMHMLRPFPTLLGPSFAARVLWGASRAFRNDAAIPAGQPGVAAEQARAGE